MDFGAWLAVFVAFIAQAGLVVSAVVAKRRSKQDRQQVAFDFIQDLNEELRTELKRRAAEYLADLTTHATATTSLQQQLSRARDEVSLAHQTAGRARQRVDYLESLLIRSGIPFQSGDQNPMMQPLPQQPAPPDPNLGAPPSS